MSNSFATPWTVTHQVPLSMGLSRQEYCSGLPFPSSGESLWPRTWTCVSCIGQWVLYHWATREAPKIDYKSQMVFKHCLAILPWFSTKLPFLLSEMCFSCLSSADDLSSCFFGEKRKTSDENIYLPITRSILLASACVCISRSVVSDSLWPHEL